MKVKMPVYIDVDNTLLDTISGIAELYSRKYGELSCFKTPDPSNVRKWNFADEMPLMTEYDIEEFFNSVMLYKYAKPKDHADEVLKELSQNNKFDVAFCSLGNSRNIAIKTRELQGLFPYIKTHYMIVKNYGSDIRMNKDKIVRDGLLFDDHHGNLNGSAVFDVLFRDNGITEWNKDYKGKYIVKDWLEFGELAYKLYDDYLDKFWR